SRGVSNRTMLNLAHMGKMPAVQETRCAILAPHWVDDSAGTEVGNVGIQRWLPLRRCPLSDNLTANSRHDLSSPILSALDGFRLSRRANFLKGALRPEGGRAIVIRSPL